MAQRVDRTPAAALEQHFQHNIAVVIGINRYEYVRRLNTARPDAEYLASLLCDDKQRRDELDRYKLFERYDEEATFEAIHRLLTDILPTEVKKAGPRTRLIFYFAGHGDAEYTDNTIKGYLFPQDAQPREQDEAQRKLLPMAEVQRRLAELDCQHVLIILDCCSAGAMAKESATRSALLPPPLYWDTLQRYVGRKARQVITSAAHNQKASDVAPGYNVGERDPDDNAAHSPFALALFEALASDPLQGRDLRGAGRDGVVTATELYLSISDSLYRQVGEAQTPGLSTLSDQGHDQGDFVFLLPGARVKKLESAPDLTRVEYDPWPRTGDQGLSQAELFAGRDEEARELARRVDAKPLVAVTGSSAVGKTTLVQAGLLPWLRAGNGAHTDGASKAWHVLPPIRLAAPAPLQTVIAHVSEALGEAGQGVGDLRALAAAWAEAHPSQRLLLAVDAPEAMFEDAGAAERAQLWAALTEAAQQNILHIIVTLRSDHWYVRSETAGDDKRTLLPAAERFELGLMNLVALHQVIDRPATARMIEFESDALVDRLAKSVDDQPAALPLLTETLHRMYLRYANTVKHEDRRNDRTLTQADYDAVGGVAGVVADLAGSVYKDQPDESSMQHVLMRLVKVEAGQYAGGSANRKDFNFPDAEAAERAGDIIDALAACGLVVQGADAAGEPFVTLGHRVLLEAWQPLREWLVEKGAEWTLQRELTARVEEWQPKQPKTLLWDDDARLPQVEERLWPADKPGDGLGDRLRWEWRVLFPPKNAAPAPDAWVNRAELEFVRASVNERSGFRQRLFGAVAAFVIIVVVLGGLAWWQRGIAVDQKVKAQKAATAEATARAFAEVKRGEAEVAATAEAQAKATAEIRREEAEREARIALSRELAANSTLELAAGRYETSLLLAIQSGLTAETAQAFDAIRAILRQPGRTEAIHEIKPVDCRSKIIFQEQPDELMVEPGFSDSDFLVLDSELGLGLGSTLTLFDPETEEEIGTLPYPTEGFLVRAFQSPDGERVLTVDIDGNALIWDLRTKKYITLDHSRPMRTYTDKQGQEHTLEDDVVNDFSQSGPLLAGAWDSSGKRVVTTGCSNLGSSDIFCGRGGAWVWDAGSGQPILSLIGHSDWVCEPRWLAGGTRVHTISSDGTEREWTVEAGSELPSFSREAGEAQAAQSAKPACSLAEDQIQTGLDNAPAAFFDKSTTCVSDRLWVTGLDGAALMDGSPHPLLESWGEPVFDAQVSPDGGRIALARCKRKWDMGSTSVVFCDEGALEVRDAHDGRLLAEVPVAGRKTTLASWSQDGAHLLVASDDDEDIFLKMKNPRVTVVDTVSWEDVFTITELDRAPYRIAWSLDSRRVLVFDSEGAHQFFLLITDLADVACHMTPRNFSWEAWNLFTSESYHPTCQNKPIPLGAVDGILGQVKQQIAAGAINEARERLSQLNLWLADSGQLERYGVVPDQFIEETLTALHDENAAKGSR